VQKESRGAYLPANIALDILMNIIILDGTDDIDCIYQRGRRLDLGVFHDKDLRLGRGDEIVTINLWTDREGRQEDSVRKNHSQG
jgi:hypothetical protein